MLPRACLPTIYLELTERVAARTTEGVSFSKAAILADQTTSISATTAASHIRRSNPSTTTNSSTEANPDPRAMPARASRYDQLQKPVSRWRRWLKVLLGLQREKLVQSCVCGGCICLWSILGKHFLWCLEVLVPCVLSGRG